MMQGGVLMMRYKIIDFRDFLKHNKGVFCTIMGYALWEMEHVCGSFHWDIHCYLVCVSVMMIFHKIMDFIGYL